ncbi:MAG: hypothetical protein ACYDIA_07090 [Candidatus Humimicrobiaceae bacterium]
MSGYTEIRKTIKNRIIEHIKNNNIYDLGAMQLNDFKSLFKDILSGNKRDLEGVILEELQVLMDLDIIKNGLSLSNYEPTFLFVTENGKKVLHDESIFIFYDPEGFIENLKSSIPSINTIVLDYYAEAVKAYFKRLILSSTVTLGVASEAVILELIESYINSSYGSLIKNKINKEWQISKKYDLFIANVNNNKASLKNDFKNALEIYLDTIDTFFKIIKRNRNQAGHPSGASFSLEELYSHLIIFKKYLEYIYEIRDFFISKNIT